MSKRASKTPTNSTKTDDQFNKRITVSAADLNFLKLVGELLTQQKPALPLLRVTHEIFERKPRHTYQLRKRLNLAFQRLCMCTHKTMYWHSFERNIYIKKKHTSWENAWTTLRRHCRRRVRSLLTSTTTTQTATHKVRKFVAAETYRYCKRYRGEHNKNIAHLQYISLTGKFSGLFGWALGGWAYLISGQKLFWFWDFNYNNADSNAQGWELKYTAIANDIRRDQKKS